MGKTSIREAADYGQSIWLDSISRSLIESGEISRFIKQGLRGLTSNPTIFEKAIGQGNDYDNRIIGLISSGKAVFDVYDELTVGDIQDAADLFLDVYKSTNGLDGYVSLEVNPELAHNTQATIKEGLRLFEKAQRRNLMIKVPATDNGFEAVEELISRGINVNVTLIFSLRQYQKTASSYINGIKRYSDKGGDIKNVRSVASVFVSRIDTVVDNLIDSKLKEASAGQVKQLQLLKGKAAVSNSHIIWSEYNKIFSSAEAKELAAKGMNLQRVLWGSTGTKNPEYSDIKYITELIAKDTVNTVPQNTYEAFLDHGVVKEAFACDSACACEIINKLEEIGIGIDVVCEELLKKGVEAFKNSFTSLLDTIKKKQERMLSEI
ncbi:MAG: transaldolase [Candidatus Omnitrophota bacterium]